MKMIARDLSLPWWELETEHLEEESMLLEALEVMEDHLAVAEQLLEEGYDTQEVLRWFREETEHLWSFIHSCGK